MNVGRTVAVKVLTATQLDEDARRTWQREARAMGTLSWHPNIVIVYDAGFAADGRAYLAMEDLEGGSLADRMASGPLAPDEVARIGIDLCGALTAAHEAGVLHRDVKPANVLIARDGRHKLADFGIATVGVDEQAQAALTPAYAPPEAFEGRHLDARADQYSLGATLHALLRGEAPFSSRSGEELMAMLLRIADEGPPPLPADVPPELAGAIYRAMSRQPDDRYPTLATFSEALAAILAPEDRPEPVVAPPRRTWPIVAAVVLVAVAAVASVALLSGGDGGETAATTIPRTTTTLDPALARTEEAVENAASAFLRNLYTYDASTIDDWYERGVALSGDPLRSQFEADGEQFRSIVRDALAASEVEELRVFVVDQAADEATVRVEVTRLTVNRQRTEPERESIEGTIDLRFEGGRWLVVGSTVAG